MIVGAEHTVVDDHDRQKDELRQVYGHELLQLDAELKCEQEEGVRKRRNNVSDRYY